jgi:hypothetical protein
MGRLAVFTKPGKKSPSAFEWNATEGLLRGEFFTFSTGIGF